MTAPVRARRGAAFALLAALAASGGPYAALAAQAAHGKAVTNGTHGARAKPPTVVRVQIVSGTPQGAHAYVMPAAPKYVAQFAQPLVVRVVGARSSKPSVRFFCATKGCELPPQEQPDEVKRIDPRTFEVASKDGKATISLIVSTDTPQTVEVLAQPVAGAGERGVPSEPFVLRAE